MDPGCPSLSAAVIMLCLLGAARCAADGGTRRILLNRTANICSCASIPPRNLTEKPNQNCSIVDGRFRYTCIAGYKRKAGTSNLIKCSKDGSWSESGLDCIPDPNLTTTTTTTKTQPAKTTVTTAHTHTSHGVTTTSISTTITASTSVQTTHSESTSASEKTQTNSAETTSAGRLDRDAPGSSQATQVTELQTTAKWDHTTSMPTTTANPTQPSNTSMVADHTGKTTALRIGCVSLIIICVLVSIYCYRRRRNRNVSQDTKETPEEQLPMNEA